MVFFSFFFEIGILLAGCVLCLNPPSESPVLSTSLLGGVCGVGRKEGREIYCLLLNLSSNVDSDIPACYLPLIAQRFSQVLFCSASCHGEPWL